MATSTRRPNVVSHKSVSSRCPERSSPVFTALAILLVALALLLPLATGIYTYTRTGHRSFLQISLVVALVPIVLSVVTVLLFSLAEGVAPRWVWRLPQLLVTLLLIDAIRRLERSLT